MSQWFKHMGSVHISLGVQNRHSFSAYGYKIITHSQLYGFRVSSYGFIVSTYGSSQQYPVSIYGFAVSVYGYVVSTYGFSSQLIEKKGLRIGVPI